MRFARPFILSLVCVGLTAGCAGGPTRSPVVTAQYLSCDGGTPAAITLYSPEEAKLSYQNKAYMLSRIETASGAKYGNRSITFWNKGVDALIETDDGGVSHCQFLPKPGI